MFFFLKHTHTHTHTEKYTKFAPIRGYFFNQKKKKKKNELQPKPQIPRHPNIPIAEKKILNQEQIWSSVWQVERAH